MQGPPQWLLKLGIPAHCIERRSSAEEKGRKFTIQPQKGDEFYRVEVDGCWLGSGASKRVDYLFWAKTTKGRKVIILVELKGRHIKKALEQMESVLEMLCKRGPTKGVHTGKHKGSPGHDRVNDGGVIALIIVSTTRGLPHYDRLREKLRQKYGVKIVVRSQIVESNKGFDALFNGL